MNLFPVIIPAVETPHYVSSEYNFRSAFLKAKPENQRWFCYDVIILSPTEVEFVCYDTRDNCYGGIGDKLVSFGATVPPELTRKFIVDQAKWVAKARRAEELAAAERTIIDQYTAEILEGVEA